MSLYILRDCRAYLHKIMSSDKNDRWRWCCCCWWWSWLRNLPCPVSALNRLTQAIFLTTREILCIVLALTFQFHSWHFLRMTKYDAGKSSSLEIVLRDLQVCSPDGAKASSSAALTLVRAVVWHDKAIQTKPCYADAPNGCYNSNPYRWCAYGIRHSPPTYTGRNRQRKRGKEMEGDRARGTEVEKEREHLQLLGVVFSTYIMRIRFLCARACVCIHVCVCAAGLEEKRRRKIRRNWQPPNPKQTTFRCSLCGHASCSCSLCGTPVFHQVQEAYNKVVGSLLSRIGRFSHERLQLSADDMNGYLHQSSFAKPSQSKVCSIYYTHSA